MSNREYKRLVNPKKLDYIVGLFGDDYIEATGAEIRYQCPFCRDLGKTYDDYKLYINVNKLVYRCPRCESVGHIDMGENLYKSNSEECSDALTQYLISLIEEPEEDEDDLSDYFVIPKSKPIPGTQAWDYIIDRGITPVDISKYDIRVPDLNSPSSMFGRFIIPNRVISNIWTDIYVARSYIGDPVRYKNSKSSKKSKIVFNLHRVPKGVNRLILNEGAINSIIAGDDSVATFGKYVSDDQLSMILKKEPEKIYVSLDTDAREQAEKLCSRIVELTSSEVYLVELPEGKDASDLGRAQYQYYLNTAKRYKTSSIYFLENFISSLGGN